MQVSLELYVPRKGSCADFADKWSATLNHPLVKLVSVTRGTSDDYCAAKNLEFLRELKRVAPHLELISHVTLSHLTPTLLDELLDIGVTSILALTGDDARSDFAATCGLEHSTHLLMWLERYYPSVRAYASAYPNGYATGGSLDDSKGVALHKTRAHPKLTLMTQWSYSLKSQLNFIGELDTPTLIGYLPFKDMAHAERVADRCGLVTSTLAERDMKVSLLKLEESESYSWQGRFVSDLCFALNANLGRAKFVAGFHLFTMNDLDVANQALDLAEPLLNPKLAKRAPAAQLTAS